MGKKVSFSIAQTAQILKLSKMKLSESQMGKKLKVSKIAVHDAIEKFKNEGTLADRKRTGRPKIFSKQDRHLMRKIVTCSPMTSGEKIRFQLQESRDVEAEAEAVETVLFLWKRKRWKREKSTASAST